MAVLPTESDYYWLCAETVDGYQTIFYSFWNGVSFDAKGIVGRLTHWRDVDYPEFPKEIKLDNKS